MITVIGIDKQHVFSLYALYTLYPQIFASIMPRKTCYQYNKKVRQALG